jgi:putative DNA primase/helicase
MAKTIMRQWEVFDKMAGSNIAKKTVSGDEARRNSFEAWKSFKEEVKDAYLIDSAVEDFAGIRLDGRSGSAARQGSCPFHDDKNPSMSVNAKEGFYYCHSAGCNAKGDVFTFISEYVGVSFKQAVLLAAEKVGIPAPDGATTSSTPKGKARPRTSFESQMNPAKLFESDLSPAFPGIREPHAKQLFPVWHPGGGRTIEACVKKYKPEMVHVYRDMSRFPIMLVLRCIHQQGGKYFMPIRVGHIPGAPGFVVDDKESKQGWMVKGTTSGHRKPIYGIEMARAWIAKKGTRILIVEGEKTCDATRDMINMRDDAADWLVVSPMGGHNASLYADWSQFMKELAESGENALDDVQFSVWPDADHVTKRKDGVEVDPQALYVRDTIGAFVTAARKEGIDPTKVDFDRACPGTDRKSGWDLADAKEEGWDGDRVTSEIDDKGMKMAIEKRFMDLDVELKDGSDLTPFEDGPEGLDDFTPLGQDGEDISDEEASSFTVVSGEGILFQPEVNEDVEDTLNMTKELMKGDPTLNAPAERIIDHGDIIAEVVEPGDIEVLDDEDDPDQTIRKGRDAIQDNPYFRALGHRSCSTYFMSLRSGEIFSTPTQSMRKQLMIALAPLRFWSSEFQNTEGRNITTDWDAAMSACIDCAYDAGYWDPAKEAGQGARIDHGRVVFNTGDRLWIQNKDNLDGTVDLAANFHGEYHYTMGQACGLPAFDRAFVEGDEDPKKLLNLIKMIDWRSETSNMSIMALFGWLCIGPICGVLPWRPHIWLDGQRAAGKSWIINNIVKPTLGDYRINVKSNSTESGLRNMLHGRAFPLIFDEAEGEMEGDRARMGNVLKLARHSATPDNSVVAHGVAGGNGQQFYSIASTFMLASITPQLEASADKTRFARAKLGPGHDLAYFSRELEQPAMDLLTPEFSARMIARMVMRSGSINKVQALMVRAISSCGAERRTADVWGTFAAGAWLLLKDKDPEDFQEALEWIEDTFKIGKELRLMSEELSDDKDHIRLFRHLVAHEVRCETINLGARNFNLGSIIQMAIAGDGDGESEDDVMDAKQASKRLADIGIRLGHDSAIAKAGERINTLIIHKNSPRITEILARTPYKTSYIDVIQQAENVKNGTIVRFGGLGTSRSVIVPLELLSLTTEEDDYDNQGTDGSR